MAVAPNEGVHWGGRPGVCGMVALSASAGAAAGPDLPGALRALLERQALSRTGAPRQPEARLAVEAIADNRLPQTFNTRLLYQRLGKP